MYREEDLHIHDRITAHDEVEALRGDLLVRLLHESHGCEHPRNLVLLAIIEVADVRNAPQLQSCTLRILARLKHDHRKKKGT